jgi:hypothetical protein
MFQTVPPISRFSLWAIHRTERVVYQQLMKPGHELLSSMIRKAGDWNKAINLIRKSGVYRWSWWGIQTQELNNPDLPEHIGYYGLRGSKLAKAPYEKCVELFKRAAVNESQLMNRNQEIPTYHHTQKAPLCLLIYALALVFLVLGVTIQDAPPIPWLFPPIGLLMIIVAASFHYLTVEDRCEMLSVRFGPLPLFRKTLQYSEIVKVEVGQMLLLDGWGIHMSMRGGWVWNLWGRDCVVLHWKKGTLRIGTDDAKNLACFIEQRIGP